MQGIRVNKHWLSSLMALAFLFLASCAPQLGAFPDHTDILFFSADVWGGTPFSEVEKKQIFFAALSSKSIKRLERGIPFATDGTANVHQFFAYYEVDATQNPPVLKNGYELVVLADKEQEFKLTNKKTGVSWLVKLGLKRS